MKNQKEIPGANTFHGRKEKRTKAKEAPQRIPLYVVNCAIAQMTVDTWQKDGEITSVGPCIVSTNEISQCVNKKGVCSNQSCDHHEKK